MPFAARGNPGPQMRPFLVRAGQRLRMVNYWLIAQAAKAAIMVLRLLPMDAALGFADRTARRLGPLFGRHRVAINNLRQAYPDKSEEEIRTIALDMWGNMARLAAEYIYLDRLFDYDPAQPNTGRIEARGVDIYERVASEKKAHIIFTGHLGNFELIPIGGEAYGLYATAMFRPPNNPYIAEYILSTRRTKMGGLIASRRGAAIALARILEAGGNVGVLVDQKFGNGIPTTFFGRACETSPLLPKLARHYECDVYPVRSIRLPGNRFRLEIEEKLELPRDKEGRVDVTATAQLLNDVVERWVREYPGQWMWFHKRWQLFLVPQESRSEADELTAVVVHHGVTGLSEEQPAFDSDAEAEQQESGKLEQPDRRTLPRNVDERQKSHRHKPAINDGEARQLDRVLARDPVAHFASQVVVVGVRAFKKPDAADRAKARRALRGR